MISIKFCIFRLRVSLYGSWKFRELGWYGFCDIDTDRAGFERHQDCPELYTVKQFFHEAWCRGQDHE